MAVESGVQGVRRVLSTAPGAHEVLRAQVANELVFAVVGHVGSGTTTVAEQLVTTLKERYRPGGPFDVTLLKARDEIIGWARERGIQVEDLQRSNLEHTRRLQDLGDAMRLEHGDNSAVARALIQRIRLTRASIQGVQASPGVPVRPDGKRRAYVIDAIRHPAEVHLLRSIYRNAFALIGVVCDEIIRLERLAGKGGKFENWGWRNVETFMQRDAKAREKHGQRVSDAFHLADYFLDNSASQTFDDGSTPDEAWNIPAQLERLVKIITHSEVVRPQVHETAMHAAYGAQMRSACLSRQVGAALVDSHGDIISTGSNEVPQAGGGTYGQGFYRPAEQDHRCAYRHAGNRRPFCSNTREQNRIIDELLEQIPQLKQVQGREREELKRAMRSSRVGGLLEFSRAVHAEMDALLAAARRGSCTAGSRLYVTTFPCHYCARHIVAAGVDEVQYIEPYPKSRALELHDDSITTVVPGWVPPSTRALHEQWTQELRESKVLFRPFVGVAPRMYARAFLKDRELKSDFTGDLEMGEPDWGTAWDISKGSYVELEAKLSHDEEVLHG